MRRRTALPLVLAAVVVALPFAAALVVPAAGSPQPTPVCTFCGAQFAEEASAANATVTVAESTAVVQVHEDGSATWTVRNHLSEGVDALRDDPDRLDRTVAALARERGLPREPTDVSARLEGDVVVVTATQPDAATRHAGLLVVEFLHERGGEPWYVVNADRFEIRAPEGSVVTNDPAGAAVSGASATWQGATGEVYHDAPDLEGSPYVVFGPDRSAATGARTTAAAALATLPIALGAFRRFVLPQTVAFGVVLAGVTAGVAAGSRRFRATLSVDRLAGSLVALGAVGTVAPAVLQGPGWVTGPPLFALGLGAVASRRTWRAGLATPRQQGLAAGGLVVAAFAVISVWYALTGQGGDPVTRAFRATAPALPFAALVPLGGALARGRRVAAWGGAAVVAFAAIPLALIDPGNPPTGLPGGIFHTVLFAVAVLTPVVGVLAILLGLSLTSDGGGDTGVAAPDRRQHEAP